MRIVVEEANFLHAHGVANFVSGHRLAGSQAIKVSFIANTLPGRTMFVRSADNSTVAETSPAVRIMIQEANFLHTSGVADFMCGNGLAAPQAIKISFIANTLPRRAVLVRPTGNPAITKAGPAVRIVVEEADFLHAHGVANFVGGTRLAGTQTINVSFIANALP